VTVTALLNFVAEHWTIAASFVLGWWASNVIGKPLTSFWADRRRALEMIEKCWGVTSIADETLHKAALDGLRHARALMDAHAKDQGIAVNAYCWVRGYDLTEAARAISGLRHLILDSPNVDEFRKNTKDYALLNLGATRGMSAYRRRDLLHMAKESRSRD
jgi:hypothetical protein